MRLVVTGSSRSVSTTETKYLVTWLAKKLVTPRLLRNVSLKFSYDPVLDKPAYEIYKDRDTVDIGYFDKAEAEADAIKHGPGHMVRRTMKYRGFFRASDFPSRKFRIQISPSMFRPQTIRSVAHEMVHLGQFASGAAIHRAAYTVWKQTKVSRDIDYRKLPWEIEAMRMEELLYEEYRNHLREYRVDRLL